MQSLTADNSDTKVRFHNQPAIISVLSSYSAPILGVTRRFMKDILASERQEHTWVLRVNQSKVAISVPPQVAAFTQLQLRYLKIQRKHLTLHKPFSFALVRALVFKMALPPRGLPSGVGRQFHQSKGTFTSLKAILRIWM